MPILYFALSFLTLPLAISRISNMLSDVHQEGLFNSLDWIRHKVGVRFDENSEVVVKPGSIAAGVMCSWCSSIWLGILGTILLICNSEVTFFVSLPFALSTMAIFIEERII
jgi:hypothetical protein